MNELAVVSSKTLKFWLYIFGIGAVFILLAAILQRFASVEIPYVSEFLNLLGIGGGAGTARNVISDGVMPRIPQAFGAARDPQVALQSPTSMQLTPPAPPAPAVFDPYAPIGGGSNGNG